MKKHFHLWIGVILIFSASCKTSRTGSASRKDDGKLEVVFIQVNDVYEIAPLAGGTSGGMARVATIRKQYKQSNPNTLLVISGDFVSPSVFNSLQYEGKRIRGKQMIEAMNAAGMDLAVFGNHEFDITESELQERINESDFQWIASNAFHMKNGKATPFEKFRNNVSSSFPTTHIMTFKDADGTTARIGFIAVTLPFNKADYVSYTDPIEAAKEMYSSIKSSCDAVVAITHLQVKEDIRLAQEIPGLAVILGGHEHDMRFEKAGNVFITKAHANARSAYIVKLDIDKSNHSTHVTPELKMLDSSVDLDSATNSVVKKWMDIGEKNYASLGFDAKQVLIERGDTLDGRESEIRRRSTDFTRLVTAAMAYACPEANVVVFNAGSIRVDDVLPPPITQYDILRGLPFGGAIREAEMQGSLLIQILEAGRKNEGGGGFLHYQPVAFNDQTGKWTINGVPLDPQKIFRVALSDFLLSGKEANLGFLTPENPAILKVFNAETSPTSLKSDIRLAIVKYLTSKGK